MTRSEGPKGEKYLLGSKLEDSKAIDVQPSVPLRVLSTQDRTSKLILRTILIRCHTSNVVSVNNQLHDA